MLRPESRHEREQEKPGLRSLWHIAQGNTEPACLRENPGLFQPPDRGNFMGKTTESAMPAPCAFCSLKFLCVAFKSREQAGFKGSLRWQEGQLGRQQKPLLLHNMLLPAPSQKEFTPPPVPPLGFCHSNLSGFAKVLDVETRHNND